MKNKNILHICSLNCKGLQQSEKRKRLIEWSNQQKCDLLLMQETHFTNDMLNKLNNEFNGKMFVSIGSSNSRGVAIWLKNNLNYKLIDEFTDSEGRLLLLNIEINENILTIVNIYAPNNAKLRNNFFKNLNSFINKNSTGQLILGGDYNNIISSIDSKHNSKPLNLKKTGSNLYKLIKSLKLKDVWREKNPNKSQFTWSRKDRTEATRIDYFLTESEVYKNCLSCDIRPVVLKYTDHNCVSLKLNMNRGVKGRGYWKLNTSILENPEYTELIVNLINKYKEKSNNKNSEIDLLWDNFKAEVRDISIQFCKEKAQKKRDEINLLENRLTVLQNLSDKTKGKNTSNIIKKIEKTEETLENLYSEKIKGNQIRSPGKWIEEGEKKLIILS